MLSRKDIARMIGESVNLIRHNEQKLGLDRAKVQINPRVVRYNETMPPAGAVTAQVLTFPYHLVAIPKAAVTEVKFEKVQ